LVFGPKKIPGLGKRLGGGIRSFKSALQTDEGQVDRKPANSGGGE
jgi:TatA/E family protein of Tat protein translocase